MVCRLMMSLDLWLGLRLRQGKHRQRQRHYEVGRLTMFLNRMVRVSSSVVTGIVTGMDSSGWVVRNLDVDTDADVVVVVAVVAMRRD